MSNSEQAVNQNKILVVDDDPYLLTAIRQTLTLHGYTVDTFDKPVEAMGRVAPGGYAAVVADVKMPKMNGLALLQAIRDLDEQLPVIMVTGHGDVAMAVTAMKNGAYDFLEKPVDDDELLASLARAVEKRNLVLENRSLNRALQMAKAAGPGFHGLIGQDPRMQDVFDKIQVVSGSEDTVFIYGETGTGKELVARAIHALSARGEEPFVAINMGALPADILESELFGYRKGAFTGATRDKVGKFEYAGKGTLFLDEICSLSTALQSKLLRVLEEKAVTPLGDNRPVAVGARIIAATNRRLEDELRAGTFRKDLFYRLNMLPIEVPPLRERRSDIPLLVENFREEYCRERKEDVRPFDRKIVSQMVRWEWSGNVRELRNYVRMLCVYQKGTGQPVLSDEPDQSGPEEVLHDRCLKEVVEQTEKEHIIQVLNMAQGQVNRAHKILGISRKCLYDKMNKHGLKADSFRELPH